MPRNAKNNKRSNTNRNKSKTFEKNVKKVLNKYVEPSVTPSTTLSGSAMSTFDTGDDALPTVIDLLPVELKSFPNTLQGNSLKLKSLKLKFLFQIPRIRRESDNALADANIKGRIVIARLRNKITAPELDDFNAMYKDGQDVNSITNSMFENFLAFNKDTWDIKKSIPFSLNSVNEFYQPPSGLGQYKVVSLDLAKYLPKTFRYTQGAGPVSTSQYLQNAGLYMFILASPSGESVAHRRVRVTTDMSYYAEYYDI